MNNDDLKLYINNEIEFHQEDKEVAQNSLPEDSYYIGYCDGKITALRYIRRVIDAINKEEILNKSYLSEKEMLNKRKGYLSK